ncbi:hypothetical protein TNCV_1404841 [Trichonephila clavipes]|nr:hypothetical protein TNCV_1404841 [Trichonephila clavipes]
MDSRSTCTPKRKWRAEVHVKVHGPENSPVDSSKLVASRSRWICVLPNHTQQIASVQLRARVPVTGVPLTAQHKTHRHCTWILE